MITIRSGLYKNRKLEIPETINAIPTAHTKTTAEIAIFLVRNEIPVFLSEVEFDSDIVRISYSYSNLRKESLFIDQNYGCENQKRCSI